MALISAWNDRSNGGDTCTTHRRPRLWKLIDGTLATINRRI